MIQNSHSTAVAAFDKFNGGAIVTKDGREVAISESAVQQSLRELESVWMKHHNHYAQVLERLMAKVEAARYVI